MQLGLECHCSAAPPSATLIPAFQKNREALMAALSERVQELDLQSLFTTQNKACHIRQAHKSLLTLYTQEKCACFPVFFSSFMVGVFCLCQLFHQYKVLNCC